MSAPYAGPAGRGGTFAEQRCFGKRQGNCAPADLCSPQGVRDSPQRTIPGTNRDVSRPRDEYGRRDCSLASAALDPRLAAFQSKIGSARGRRRRNYGGPPNLIASLSKSRPFFSKLFQRKLRRFCGISKSYKGQKPKESLPNFFRRAGLLLDALTTSSGRIPPAGRREGPRAFSRWSRAFTLGGGG